MEHRGKTRNVSKARATNQIPSQSELWQGILVMFYALTVFLTVLLLLISVYFIKLTYLCSMKLRGKTTNFSKASTKNQIPSRSIWTPTSYSFNVLCTKNRGKTVFLTVLLLLTSVYFIKLTYLCSMKRRGKTTNFSKASAKNQIPSRSEPRQATLLIFYCVS